MTSYRIFTVLLAVVLASSLSARVQLPALYSDNMVLQQQSDVVLRGRAEAGATVTMQCSWMRRDLTAQANAEGRFELQFHTPKAGGPHTLLFIDTDTLILHNVMVGEVWLGSGQSNMEMPLAGWGKVLNYQEEIRQADYPQIRLLQVPKTMAFSPIDPLAADMGKWQVCSPQTVEEFSALGYFYARELWQRLHVPVGIINSSWGGTPAEAWTSDKTLGLVAGYTEEVEALRAIGFDAVRIQQRYDDQYAHWLDCVAEIDRGLSGDWASPALDDSQWPTMALPQLFDKEVLPQFDGVVWYRLTVVIPPSLAGQSLSLRLGMIDDEDITYWNGTSIAHGAGYNSQRCYTVPADLVKAGQNVLAVRVQDTGGEGGIWGAPEDLFVSSSDGQTISLAGDWRYHIGCSLTELPSAPLSPSSAGFPSVLFNAMIAPMQGFPMAGVIWYQGCANVGRAAQYKALFQALIHDWRAFFDRPDMPFYFVQLANYLSPSSLQPESEWAALREAQACAADIEGVEMMCNIDLGDAADIHPKNKQEVARRLALIALNRHYGKPVSCQAPKYESYEVVGREVHIRFDYSCSGEKLLPESELSGFIIAGPDFTWHVADARVVGDEVVVSSPEVTIPIAVCYGWADNPTCTLRTPSGLHVAPFRTDNQ